MEDLSLRAAFHRALDPVAPPAPWLREATLEKLRERRRTQAAGARGRNARWSLPAVMPRLTAVALILALLLASMALFAALNVYLHGVPALGPHHASRACMPLDQYVGPDGSRWQGGPPPKVPDWVASSQAACVLDSAHAWVTETANLGLTVMATADGGRTWRQGQQLPARGSSLSVLLDFEDELHGWLLTDLGTSTVPNFQRVLYATTDGGAHWARMASADDSSASALGRTANYCPETGLVMSTAGSGWITWNCLGRSTRTAPEVVTTDDGGRTWTALTLPAASTAASGSCSAQPVVFSSGHIAIPFYCASGEHRAGVYRSGDGGATWAIGDLPFVTQANVEFADGLTGYLVKGRPNGDAASGSTLYGTQDGGKSWAIVGHDMFPGTNVNGYGFFDPSNGYMVAGAYLWLTRDGGRHWTVAPPNRSIGYTVCSQPAAAVAPATALTSPRMFGTSAGWDAGARHTSDGGAHWTASPPPIVKLATSGYGEDFLDANTAWAAEAVGSPTACADHVFVYRTIDGGQSWSRIASVNVPVKDGSREWTPSLYFSDRQHGWLFATTGALYRTDDGGVRWTAVSMNAGATNTGCTAGPGVYFSSSTTGWLPLQCPFDQNQSPGPYRLGVSRDGGVTWSVQTIAASLQTYGSVLPVFTDAQHGVIWDGPFGMLAITADGGRTWSLRTPPLSGYACIGKGGVSTICSDESVAGVSFVDASRGWSVVGVFSAPQGKGGPIYMTYRVERTLNGGRTWTVIARLPTRPAPDGPETLQFVDSSDGFWMDGSRWYRTRDGGRTWSLVFTGVEPQT